MPDPARRRDAPHRAILDAAWAEFEAHGLRALTVEAIAARAGVSKATIYRWWPGKAAVVLDALEERILPAIAFPDTGSAVEDLRLQLRAVAELLTGTTTGAAYLSLITESRDDPALEQALSERYIAGRRQAAAAVLVRGVERGDLRPDLDPGLVIDALYGAVYYRLLVSHAPVDGDYVDGLVAEFLPALAAPPR